MDPIRISTVKRVKEWCEASHGRIAEAIFFQAGRLVVVIICDWLHGWRFFIPHHLHSEPG
jgi:hypothetical protein